MVLAFVTELSLRGAWYATMTIGQGLYWLAFGSPPDEKKMLLDKITAMEEREKQLLDKLEVISTKIEKLNSS